MISLFGSYVKDEELAQIKSCFDKQWIGIGPKVSEFEEKLKEKTHSKDVIFVNSGSNALQLAIHLLELPKGSEVILPSFTWIACANAILLNQLRPIFCDVDLNSGNMRASDIESKITLQTSAIMVVHYAGKPVDMDAIKKFKLPIIEDAAHSIDSYYKGKHCGAIGDVGIFSFDAVKNITTGEGGAVLVNDNYKAQLARKLRYCGISKSGFEASASKNRWWEYEISGQFPKMINTDLAAGIGLAQLSKLDLFQKRRKQLWEHYTSIFKEQWASTWIEPFDSSNKDEQHSYFTYCIKLHKGSRDQLAKFLYELGIYTSLRFHPLHLNSFYGQTHVDLPNCQWLNENALNIPLHHRLTDQEIEYIIKSLQQYRRKYL